METLIEYLRLKKEICKNNNKNDKNEIRFIGISEETKKNYTVTVYIEIFQKSFPFFTFHIFFLKN